MPATPRGTVVGALAMGLGDAPAGGVATESARR